MWYNTPNITCVRARTSHYCTDKGVTDLNEIAISKPPGRHSAGVFPTGGQTEMLFKCLSGSRHGTRAVHTLTPGCKSCYTLYRVGKRGTAGAGDDR